MRSMREPEKIILLILIVSVGVVVLAHASTGGYMGQVTYEEGVAETELHRVWQSYEDVTDQIGTEPPEGEGALWEVSAKEGDVGNYGIGSTPADYGESVSAVWKKKWKYFDSKTPLFTKTELMDSSSVRNVFIPLGSGQLDSVDKVINDKWLSEDISLSDLKTGEFWNGLEAPASKESIGSTVLVIANQRLKVTYGAKSEDKHSSWYKDTRGWGWVSKTSILNSPNLQLIEGSTQLTNKIYDKKMIPKKENTTVSCLGALNTDSLGILPSDDRDTLGLTDSVKDFLRDAPFYDEIMSLKYVKGAGGLACYEPPDMASTLNGHPLGNVTASTPVVDVSVQPGGGREAHWIIRIEDGADFCDSPRTLKITIPIVYKIDIQTELPDPPSKDSIPEDVKSELEGYIDNTIGDYSLSEVESLLENYKNRLDSLPDIDEQVEKATENMVSIENIRKYFNSFAEGYRNNLEMNLPELEEYTKSMSEWSATWENIEEVDWSERPEIPEIEPVELPDLPDYTSGGDIQSVQRYEQEMPKIKQGVEGDVKEKRKPSPWNLENILIDLAIVIPIVGGVSGLIWYVSKEE